MMNLTAKAKEFINKQGNIITVKIEKRTTYGWGGSRITTCPSVRLGQPETDCNEYNTLLLDGVTVYSHSSMQQFNKPRTVEIDVEDDVLIARIVMRRE